MKEAPSGNPTHGSCKPASPDSKSKIMVEIREFEEQHREGVLYIYEHVMHTPREDAVADLENVLRMATGRVFVALESDGTVVGYSTFWFTKWNMIGYIGMIGVLSGHQGKGIGKKLMKAMEDFARTSGVRKIYVDTGSDNLQANIFYLKCGYFPECAKYDFYSPGVHGIYYVKYLDGGGNGENG